jgi:hypothetical protein
MTRISVLFMVLLFSAKPIFANLPTFFGNEPIPSSLDDDFFKKKKKKKKKKSSGGGAEGLNFQHGYGASLFLSLPGDSLKQNGTNGWGISYFPSIQLKGISETMGLRLAASPSFGFAGSVNSQSGGSFAISLDLPLDLELHLGNQENEGFSGHIGAGFGINRLNSSDWGLFKAKGPHFTAGIKFPFRGSMYGVRGAYLLNINKADVYGNGSNNVVSLSAYRMF